MEIEANRLAADQMAEEVVAGLRKLAQKKKVRKGPDQAAEAPAVQAPAFARTTAVEKS